MLKKPQNIYLPIDRMAAKVFKIPDMAKRGEWVTNFVLSLCGEAKDEFANELIEKGRFDIYKDLMRQWRYNAKKALDKDATDKQIHEWCMAEYGDEYLEALEILTKNSKRIRKNLSSITAAAATREGVDVVPDRESGSFARTTGCNNKGESNTGSTVPAVRPESGKVYDQETDQISANSPAGAGVNLDSTQTISPDASLGNEEGVTNNGSTITRNGSRANCTSATSGQTIEAPEQAGEGGVSPEVGCQASSLPSPISKPKTDPKPVKKKAEPEEHKFPHGEFENIMLTTKEYIQLCERLDNADSLIDEADQYFEAQPDKKKKYKSHYAMLLNWDRRRKEVETPSRVRRFKTAVDQDQEEIRKLAEYYAAQERDEQRAKPKMKLLGVV